MFRKYYGGRKGHYRICKNCEKINNREKYLAGKVDLTKSEADELKKIQELWDYQRRAGLSPPNTDRTLLDLQQDLDDSLAEYKQMAEEFEAAAPPEAGTIPEALRIWLTEELVEEPDHYLDVIYEELQNTYRPVTHIGADNTPVYDDTYRAVLQEILTRFNEYEDEYYKDDR